MSAVYPFLMWCICSQYYMVRNGNQYTIHLMGKSVTVTVANSENLQ